MEPSGETTPSRSSPPPADVPVRVLVVDDHPVVTDGVRLLLNGHPTFEVVGSACTAADALEAAATTAPDLVLLDLRLPGSDPPELVRRLRQLRPAVKVVLFTAHPDSSLLSATLEAGVDGCLLKDAGAGDLADSLEQVVRGRTVFDPRLGSRPDLTLGERLSGTGLTRREYDVLRLVATGLTNPEIADRLVLTRNTVKGYLQAAMQKLGARNRVEAIAKAHEARLL
jgi:two-component system nitrate/nitrite response regulator NarL